MTSDGVPGPSARPDGRTATNGAGTRTRSWVHADRAFVAGATILLAVWAAYWIRFGVDLADGGFAVATQLRVAEGDLPFRDELSPLVLGALPGVPSTWLWHELFGLSGIVLAARVTFVLAALATGALSYRALRTVVSAPAAFAGVTVALVALPYGIPVLSYNTVPILGTVVSASALLATVETRSRRWAIVSGAALGLAAVSNPQYLPTGVVVAVVAAAWLPWRLWLGTVAAAAAPLTAFALWLIAVPGVDRVLRAAAYLRESRSVVVAPGVRLRHNLDNLASQLIAPSYLALLLLAGLVAVLVLLRPRSRLTGAALALLPTVSLVPVLRVAWRDVPAGQTSLTPTGDIGATTLHGSAALVGVMLLPCVVWLARSARRPLTGLATYAVGLGVVVTPVLAYSTASGPSRGIAATGLAVPVLVLVVTAVEAAARAGRPLAYIAGLGVTCAMIGIGSATVFPTVPVETASQPVKSGAWAGMRGRPGDVATAQFLRKALVEHTSPGDRVLGISTPAFLLLGDVRAGTPSLWLSFGGTADRRAVDWLEGPGHAPDVTLVYGYDARTLTTAPELRADPLATFIRKNFTVVYSSVSPPLTVLRRND